MNHKKIDSAKKGSALLIVLGMIAFLIVSAVAFSSWMRTSRLPSSFLKRAVSSRLLVKAAMAEAIGEIDAAIGNNPHPGIGNLKYAYPPFDDKGGSIFASNHNHWVSRVYIGNDVRTSSDDASQHLASQDDTVSPLCMEALAYLPIPLINEVCYYSRRSNAAIWKNFDFDAGRYAFCAVDVSDYLDVNTLFANKGRSSASGRRFTLAHMFEDVDHQNGPGSDQTKWDAFMQKFRNESSDGTISFANKVPLISLADFNLAFGNLGGLFGYLSPFYKYVEPGSSYKDILAAAGCSEWDGDEYNVPQNNEKIRQMAFVTDGWYPTDSNVKTLFQPFKDYTCTFPLDVLTKMNMDAKDDISKCICPFGLMQLYDYLDADSVPLSLSVPTVERTPMVCGIQPMIQQLKLAISAPEETDDSVESANKLTKKFKKTFKYKLSGAGFNALRASELKLLVAYPFRHHDSEKFELEGRLSLFFSKSELELRTKSAGDVIHYTRNYSKTDSAFFDSGVVSIRYSDSPQPFTSVNTEDEAVRLISLKSSNPNVPSLVEGAPLLTVTYEAEQTRKDPSDPWDPLDSDILNNAKDCLKFAHTDFPPLNEHGEVEEEFSNDEKLLTFLKDGKSNKYELNLAVWALVKQNNKTVDLVPACILDDEVNGVSAGLLRTQHKQLKDYTGKQYPLLKFSTGLVLNYASIPKVENGESDLSSLIKPIVISDPRFNFAPEFWFESTANALDASVWLKQDSHSVGNTAEDSDGLGEGRDGDIFMMVSNQEYLQSIYELANLSRFTDFYQKDADYLNRDYRGPYWKNFPDRTSICKNFGETVAWGRQLVWRTYDPFPDRYKAAQHNSSQDGDDFEGIEYSTGSGLRINPYSDSTNNIVLMAFANTPHDWACASSNVDSKVNSGTKPFFTMTAKEFNQDYAWNEYSSGAQLKWEDLKKIATKFSASIREAFDRNATNFSDDPKGDVTDANQTVFDEAWEDMDWYIKGDAPDVAQKKLCGVTLTGDKIYNSDKKFLYGYWKDCFAARQQLFLVFVRAEPMMMGSGSSKNVPPQLGGRAVALVWRDPNPSKPQNDGKATGVRPHKTRILFYRQFD